MGMEVLFSAALFRRVSFGQLDYFNYSTQRIRDRSALQSNFRTDPREITNPPSRCTPPTFLINNVAPFPRRNETKRIRNLRPRILKFGSCTALKKPSSGMIDASNLSDRASERALFSVRARGTRC